MCLFNKKTVLGEVDTDILKHTISYNMKIGGGVKVTFEKKDGTIRSMIVKFDEETLRPKNPEDPRTQRRRETNKANANMVVTEYLPESRSFQVRTVPLNKVLFVESVD